MRTAAMMRLACDQGGVVRIGLSIRGDFRWFTGESRMTRASTARLNMPRRTIRYSLIVTALTLAECKAIQLFKCATVNLETFRSMPYRQDFRRIPRMDLRHFWVLGATPLRVAS